ncbi:MAG TPA: DUF485 domain-containing protein [Bacillus bacterium]|uniref:DUF485 domain-containing protein n=1 Tax=Siminovitchia fordii TaxID=254759 RepID=UPI00037C3886|nr:DUF485 domain-containing protein [Siminovitchia fordii]HBZ10658.1 DUF485 domain-containing protein [Bacillus sp. (in: firmicutes)]
MREAVIFQQLLKRKKKLILPMTFFFVLFYFALPILIWFFPEWIYKENPSSFIPWWWLFAFFQLIVTWILGWVYWCKAKKYDQLIEDLKQGKNI